MGLLQCIYLKPWLLAFIWFLQTLLQHRHSAIHSETIRVLSPRVGLTSQGINNGGGDPCIMNEEKTHPGTGTCLLQNVYSVNCHLNNSDKVREDTFSLICYKIM